MTDEIQARAAADRSGNEHPEEQPSKRQGDRRLRDVAVVLPVVLLLTFLPPYIRIFDQNGLLGGLPLLLVYIFGIWSIAILASALLGHRLSRSETEKANDGGQAVVRGERTEPHGQAGREI